MTKLEQIRDAISLFDLDGAGPDYDANLMKAARAAVEALREGWDGMFEAAMALPGSQEPGAPWAPPMPDEVWKATLDSILSEKPE